MNKVDTAIADLESILEKLGDIHSRLKEYKDEVEAVERARDKMRGRKPKKDDKVN
jgi:hypothetical protein